MTETPQHDLLTEPVFTIDGDGERLECSLAELLSRIGRGERSELVYLMPHQQHVMHAFLVQLAALVCVRSGDARLDRSEEEWRSALLELAGSREAFCLLVPDLNKPAFMQPPVTDGAIDKKWSTIDTPDDLDILITAKNHDLKFGRIRRARVEHWTFSLISLQTQQGFLGAGNYGVARMNGGFGNRAGLGTSSSVALHSHVRRDVTMLLDQRKELLSDAYVFDPKGHHLLWKEPWNGETALALSKLDAYFIEVCRRVRLVREEGQIVARARPTSSSRVDAKDLKGNVGDPWIPLKLTGEALTLDGGGFHYSRMSDLLFQDNWVRPPALSLRSDDGSSPVAIARALVRGQGKTEGLHERVIPIPGKTRSLFASPDGRSRLGKLAALRIQAAKDVRLKVLKPALCVLMQGGPEQLRFDDDRANALLDTLDRAIDDGFFTRLFEDIELSDDEQRHRFDKWLFELAKGFFEKGVDSLPIPNARRERAIAHAERSFYGSARKNLPMAFPTERSSESSEGDSV